MQYPAYCDCINAIVLSGCLMLQKAMDVQFRELLIKPLQKLNADGNGIGKGAVIVVDGLDECATVERQVQIINLIATSIHEQTTPFLWAFFSWPGRPMSTFTSMNTTNISWKLPQVLSGTVDGNIEA
jgi:hypothetical protein